MTKQVVIEGFFMRNALYFVVDFKREEGCDIFINLREIVVCCLKRKTK